MDLGTIQSELSARAVGDALGTPSGSPAARNNNSALSGVGKNDFLQLLVAQLRNQDPLKPMEDREFIAQMAQLNTVEQVSAMNEKLGELLSFEAMTQASSLIGKTVEAKPPGSAPIKGVVQEVRLDDGIPVLVVGNQMVYLNEIRAVVAT